MHKNKVQINVQTYPFGIEPYVPMYVPAGFSIAELLDNSGLRFMPNLQYRVFLGDQLIHREHYETLRPAPDSLLIVKAVPQSGDDNKIVRTVLTIAVVALSFYTGGLATAAYGSFWGAATAAAVSYAGMYLINAIAPPPEPAIGGRFEGGVDPQTFGIEGARNQVQQWGPIPVLLGRQRFAPPFGAQPFTDIEGDKQYLRLLFCLGYGPMTIEEMRIGETDINNFTGDGSEGNVELYVHDNFDPLASDPDEFILIPDDVNTEGLSITLTQAAGYVERTTQPNTDEIIIDIIATNGLLQFNAQGNKQSRSVIYAVEYRDSDSSDPGDWTAGPTGLAVSQQQVTITKPDTFYGNPDNEQGQTAYSIFSVGIDKATGVVEVFLGYVANYNTYFPPVPNTHWKIADGYLSSIDGYIFTDRRTSIIPPRDVDSADGDFEPSVSQESDGDLVITVAAGTLYGDFEIVGMTSSTVMKSVRFRVPTGQYDVRIKRSTADSTSDTVRDIITWTALRSVRKISPVQISGLTFVEMRVKATDQLNGIIDTFNVTASSKILSYVGSSGWVLRESFNPADLFRHVLQGVMNKRALPDSMLDITQLEYFHDFCVTNGYSFNQYRNTEGSTWDVLRLICAAGRATPHYLDGKYTVVIDETRTDIIQHFTPRNSYNFRAERNYIDPPHAFRVRFPNADKDYRSDERIVYDDGYNESNATKFEELQLPGITYSDLAWKFGRFHLAQIRLRPERYTFGVDIENLICTRGDLIRVTHDIPLWGLGFGRITAVGTESDGDFSSIDLDSAVTMESGKSYSVRVKQSSGTSLLANVVLDVGEQTSLTFIAPIVPTGDDLAVGDLFLFGEVGSESVELVILQINPRNELDAEIIAVDYSPDIYTADTGTIPAFSSQVSIPAGLITPSIESIQSDEDVLVDIGGRLVPKILIKFLNAPDKPYNELSHVEGQYRTTNGLDESWIRLPQIDIYATDVSVNGVEESISYNLRFRYVYKDGRFGSWLNQTHTVIGMSTDPSDVTGFGMDILDSQATLKWDPVADKDLSHYEVRYTPTTPSSADSSGAEVSWGSANVLVEQIPKGSSTVTVPINPGTYLIKAVDYGGRVSINAAQIVTTAEASALSRVVVETISEDPDFLGVKTDVVVTSLGQLELDVESNGEVISSGEYEFDNVIDMGQIYPTRLVSTIGVEGSNINNTLDTWDDLSLITDLAGANNEQWQVTMYVSVTQDDPADSGAFWSGWTKLGLSDITGRGFRFKIILESFNISVTPVISQLEISADLKERTEGNNNLTSGAGTYAVVFANPYYATPAVAITADDMATGDYPTLTLKSRTGFTIEFKNTGGSSVSRVFDWIATGHGKDLS